MAARTAGPGPSMVLALSHEYFVKDAAKRVLGYGYHRVTKKVQQVVLESFSDDNLVLRNPTTLYQAHIFASEETEVEILDRHFRVTFGANTPKVGGGISYEYENKESKASETNRFSCAVTCFCVDECAFKVIPFIKAVLSDPNNGDGVICSGKAFTGYQILLDIETIGNSDVSKTTHSTNAHLSILQGLIPLNASGSRGMSKLKGKQITQISIKMLKGHGYAPPAIDYAGIRTPGDIQAAIEKVRSHFLYNSSKKRSDISIGRMKTLRLSLHYL